MDDCVFEAYVTNLGKYNEGALVGEWVKFHTRRDAGGIQANRDQRTV
jgi:hypothetical protein